MKLPKGTSIFDPDIIGEKIRKTISAQGLQYTLRQYFLSMDDRRNPLQIQVALPDALMSGFAIFALKMPSLLQFDAIRRNAARTHNLKSLFGIHGIPSDTGLREILDEIPPSELRGAFTKIFSTLQRGKVLEDYTFLDGYYLVSIDGSGYFSSDKIHCDSCCEKHHKKDGLVSYYHQLLSAVLVHPNNKEVFPLCPEPIVKQDGDKKNDCERNACRRLLELVRKEHPKLKMMIVEDGLASNAPHIKDLKQHGMSFILGAKPGDHKSLFEHVEEQELAGRVREIVAHEKNSVHVFRYINDVPLNASKETVRVNFLDYREIRRGGQELKFSWVTDITITDDNVNQLMRGGRARWKIENETFNTLKNQGYHFEHNFGHGYKHLTTVLAMLMMLAFLVDQVQQRCCKLFRAARRATINGREFWERVRALFMDFLFDSWTEFSPQLPMAFNHLDR